MAIHYLNPDDEPRECRRCEVDGTGTGTLLDFDGTNPEPCDVCDGSGQLGNPDGPSVDIREGMDGKRWGWRIIGRWNTALEAKHQGWNRPYPTREAALEAARKAQREEA